MVLEVFSNTLSWLLLIYRRNTAIHKIGILQKKLERIFVFRGCFKNSKGQHFFGRHEDLANDVASVFTLLQEFLVLESLSIEKQVANRSEMLAVDVTLDSKMREALYVLFAEDDAAIKETFGSSIRRELSGHGREFKRQFEGVYVETFTDLYGIKLNSL